MIASERERFVRTCCGGFLLLLLLLRTAWGAKVGTNGKSHGQRFAMEPQDQTAIVGSRVTLPCRVIDKVGMLQWTKDDFGLGTHRNLSGFDRYSMVGSDEEGDFSLDIYPVMLDDDAKYQCQVGPGADGQLGIRSRFATLTILVPPEPPKIIQGDFMVTTEDREIELECISVGGKPAAEITWIDGLGNVLTTGIDYMKEPLPDSRRFTAKSVLKLTPKKEHHNTTFTCQAQNTADRTYRAAKLKLEVKYAPKVSVSVIGGALAGGRIPEGAEVRLSCHADANPNDLTYRWYINDELVVGDYTTEMLIHNITRKFHDAIVKCEVHNAVGKSEESETLDISYGPVFRTRPKSVEADIGTEVSLFCDVDGNPAPDIVWIHDPTDRVVRTSSNFTTTVTQETAGRYYCKASVMGFPEIGAEATVYLKGPPVISSSQRQHGIVGDNARLECVAFSVPKARHVSWTFNGREINTSNDQDYSILEDPLPEGIKSTLIIRESQSRHFGRYNCTVVNDYGNDVLEIDLLPQTIAPSLIIIVCVGLSVAITILVVIFLCIFLKRGKKKLPPADVIPEHHISEKGCKESDRSSNISDLKVDIRSGSCEPDYSETCSGSDSIATRLAANILGSNQTTAIGGGVPLAGPVKIPNDYRYSGDYTDPLGHLQQLKSGQNNNGYVPYVDYARDYSPPPQTLTAMRTSSATMNGQLPTGGNFSLNRHRTTELRQDNGLPSVQNSLNSLPNGFLGQPLLQNGLSIDPRYSATYGNPYLRTSNASLPPLPPPSTANPAATPAPPPYNAATRISQATPPTTTSGSSGISLGSVGSLGSGSTTTLLPSQVSASPSGQFILPANGNLKKSGALATHV
ncbi:irregular chiasm C-roughest protein-like [Lutzomyia longipalpis]|uniref:irregular chiasm C-roughest protein-like n=1 Tax=Lutzomyia longipalpis TaxID=7200 RepID=UPI002483B9B8|nr:irregular chiasm C-roughest protein-like [Lutzomyia longipalpis]XP_055682497.1 irregular chiasm C-roughest protein-like [Lutzomyia longipalpis]XP_055682498.1 irregular chiasm C-roughest protein-like [Lutzomyia longipalpis]XP_055682499.1 irregular chiasm C-roughest protein-like [Lutzomyia longipalpis]XP_055682500.1 irregular chiasm C-roughest protein-like [Lutzomyia longipalpis]XP_055682501.1 irregular chiasm C-roughest protein-like [Lutzomyia longipalpis]